VGWCQTATQCGSYAVDELFVYNRTVRTSAEELQRSAVQALIDACHRVGIEVTATSDPSIVRVQPTDGNPVDLHVQGRAVVSGDVPIDDGEQRVVVGDVVTGSARDSLRAQGMSWLDRRGHLRLIVEEVLVDTAITPLPRRTAGDDVPTDPFGRGRATVEVALALLLSPDDPPGIRQLAREVDLAPSTVSQAHARLERTSLVTPEGPPLLPELFWELADRWRPRWIHVAADPSRELIDSHPGRWVKAGDAVASAQGAPVVVGAGAPSAWYVDSQTALRDVRQDLGDAPTGKWACRVAVAPSRLVHTRANEATRNGVRQVPEVVSALDLARDPSRGREILAAWSQLPDGRTAVWQG
jgi:hypothetical protein